MSFWVINGCPNEKGGLHSLKGTTLCANHDRWHVSNTIQVMFGVFYSAVLFSFIVISE